MAHENVDFDFVHELGGSPSAATYESDMLPMEVENVPFMVELLSTDCAPDQFLREITQNGIDAINRTSIAAGRIVWDCNWNYFKDNGVFKLCCLDNGEGMDSEDMRHFIAKMFASTYKQNRKGNYGIGAKASGLKVSPHGIVYESWKKGSKFGYACHLWIDPNTGSPGLRRWPNGRHVIRLSGEAKPSWIGSAKNKVKFVHGTRVTFLGKNAEDNTMEPPDGTGGRDNKTVVRWVHRSLNDRFFDPVSGHIKICARESYRDYLHEDVKISKNSCLRTVVGHKGFMLSLGKTGGKGPVALHHGIVDLSVADMSAQEGEVPPCRAYWFILDSERDLNSSFLQPPGLLGLLYQGEVYEMFGGIKGITILREFGVHFGHKTVAIFVEPDENHPGVQCNGVRTRLEFHSKPLPLHMIGKAFINKMPEALRIHIELAGVSASVDMGESYRHRVHSRVRRFIKAMKDGLRGTYHPNGDNLVSVYVGPNEGDEGATPPEDANLPPPPSPPEPPTPPKPRPPSSPRPPRPKPEPRPEDKAMRTFQAGAIDEDEDGLDYLDSEIPEVSWEKDAEDLEGAAAKYSHNDNKIFANENFVLFQGMKEEMSNRFAHVSSPAKLAIIDEEIKFFYEVQLIEAVLRRKMTLEHAGASPSEIIRALTSETLTGAVSPWSSAQQSILKALSHSSKLGRTRT